MMVKPKLLARSALVLLATALSCDKPVAPPTTGSIALVLVSETGTPMIVSDLPEGASLVNLIGDGPANILLDAVRVSVSGQMSKTVTDNTPDGSVFDVQVTDLDPGTYTVVVEGLAGGKVAHYGQTQNITVVAGQTAQAPVTFNVFRPTLTSPNPGSEDTVDVLRFPVAFAAVQNATSYLVEWSTAPSMTSPSSKSITTTSTDVDVTAEGTYYYRVTAVNSAVGTSGLPSDPRPVNVVQLVATVTVTPASPTIAYGATQQFTAEAKDALNATVANVTWFWASSNHTVATVSQSGLVTSVGPGSATITAVGKGTPGSAALTVNQPAGTKLTFATQPADAASGQSLGSVKVAIQNVLNQTITTDNTTQITVAIGANPGSGALAGTATATVTAGVATFSNLSINKTGDGYTLTAVANSLSGATSTAFDVSPGAATKLAFGIQPATVPLDDPVSPAIQVEVRDANDNVVTGARNEITLALGTNPTSAALGGTVKVNAVAGIATFSNVSVSKAGTGYVLAATATGLTAANSAAFDISASGPAAKLVFAVQPQSVTADQYIAPLEVEIQDAQGRRVTSDNATQVTLGIGTNPTSATLSGTVTATANTGRAVFTSAGIEPAANGYTLTAAATGLSGTTSTAFNVTHGAPDHLAFSVEPTASVAGDALSPAVQVTVEDFWGNRATSARDEVTIAISNNPSAGGTGVLTGTKKVNAIDGVASFTGLWINKTGTGYTLAATASSLTGATSAGFNIAPAAPAKLAFSQQPTNVLGSRLITPGVTVTITDQFDNATTANNNVTLSLGENPWKTVFAAGASLSGTLTVAGNNGTATFNNLRIDKPAPGYRLAASAGTLTASLSNPFNVNLVVQSISTPVNGSHTCAITATANGVTPVATYCWGYNGNGQLGVSPMVQQQDSIPVLTGGVQTFVSVTTGSNHSCGLTAAGAAYCWGYNYYGQLGDGTNGPGTDKSTPVAVSGGLTFAQIEAGYIHTCGVTTSNGLNNATDRQVYCWGYNSLGQLGDGTTADKNVPTRVAQGPSNLQTAEATQVTTGIYHTCARAPNGNAYCWGYNYYGQLGDGSLFASCTAQCNAPNQNVPVLVTGAISWSSLDAGAYHTCGISAVPGNPGYCWGNGGSGQLGHSANTNHTSPQSVFGGFNWSSISGGSNHTCGVTSTGVGYCWGNNGNGELGDDNSPTDSNQPVTVAGSLTFDRISAGANHTCGRTTNFNAYCWGYNGNGQLGSPGTNGVKKTPTQIIQ